MYSATHEANKCTHDIGASFPSRGRTKTLSAETAAVGCSERAVESTVWSGAEWKNVKVEALQPITIELARYLGD